MRAGVAFTALTLALGLAACAGTSEGPLEANRMRLTALDVAADPKVDMRYPALLRYEASGDVRIIDSCFTWIDDDSFLQRLDEATGLGDGPYCLAPESAAVPGTVQTMLVSGYPGTYRLVVYTRYEGGGAVRTTNAVAQQVTVTRRLPQSGS
jgi:hypothetical protein